MSDNKHLRGTMSGMCAFAVDRVRPMLGRLALAVGLIGCYGLVVHLLLAGGLNGGRLLLALLLLLGGAVMSFVARRLDRQPAARLLAVLTALGCGLWIFMGYAWLGLVQWPLGRPGQLSEYGWLLSSHAALSLTVLSCATWTLSGPWRRPCHSKPFLPAERHLIRWGIWRSQSRLGELLLIGTAAGSWIWAVSYVSSTPATATGQGVALAAIALLKAGMTGATEEICHRGLVQPAAIAGFGWTVGIIFQAVFYTVFHVHLNPAFYNLPGFLVGVFLLGLLFGVVTQYTSGIGWAAIVHTALGLGIEWNNLS